MKNRNQLWRGIVAGIMLYTLTIIISELPLIGLHSMLFSFGFCAIEIAGVLVVVYEVACNRLSFGMSIVKSAAILSSISVLTIINGYLEIIPFLHKVLSISINAATGNVSGMITFTFLLTIGIACLLSVVAVGITCIAKKQKN